MDKIEKQILENQIEIMGFLNGLRTTMINLSSSKDAKLIEDMPWFSKQIKMSEKILKELK